MSSPVLRRIVVGPLDTNCWVLHARHDRRALLVDPGDDADRILAGIVDLDIVGIAVTHAHFDHVLGLPEVAEALRVPVLAHPADTPVWPHELATLRRDGHWDAGTATTELLARDPTVLTPAASRRLWDGDTRSVADGQVLRVGALEVRVLHTPGHTPGGISLSVPGHLLSGDTLFPGGPGLTGPPLSDFPTIMASVGRLLALPSNTLIHPGHGPDTTVGTERPQLPEWHRRGY